MKVTRHESLNAAKATYERDIDEAAGEVRASYASNGPFIAAEYERAAATADAYLAGDTSNDASVTAWAQAAGMTRAEAAQDIIATRDQWHAVLDQVRSIRLDGKSRVRAATSVRQAYDRAQAAIAELRVLTA